jgi:drug/metabolite transporter (DMT)-like permease
MTVTASTVAHMQSFSQNVPLLVVALLVVDGMHFVFARALKDYVHPVTGVLLVLGVGTLQIGLYAASQGKLRFETLRQHRWFFLSIGFLVAASTGINYLAVEFIDPGTASLLAETSILFGVALGVWWLKDKLSTQQIIGAIIAVVGVVIITYDPKDILSFGAVMVLVSSAMYALHAAVVKRYGSGIEFVEFFFWRMVATTGFLLLSAAVQNRLTLPTDGRAWLIILIAATVDIAISRTLYCLALRRLSVSIHSLILTLSPVVAIL